MKDKRLRRALKEWTTATQQNDAEEGIVGYALFDTVKRAFVSFEGVEYQPYETYTGNIEVAYVAGVMVICGVWGFEDGGVSC